MNFHKIPALAAVFLGLSLAFSIAVAGPRTELEAKGIPFTVENFLARAAKGDLEAVLLFLAAGMAVNANVEGTTALIEAAIKGRTETARFLVEKGADVNAFDSTGETPLIAAAGKGNLALVEFLVARGAEVNPKQTPSTPLRSAVTRGNIPVVRFLLAHGAEVNAKSTDHMRGDLPALITAVEKGNIALVRLLLQQGADPDIWGGETMPLFSALEKKNTEIALLLLNHGADVNGSLSTSANSVPALVFAAGYENLAVVEFLLARGADVNAKAMPYGITALMAAASDGNAPIAKLLLEKGARRDVTNDDGKTALDFAREKNHTAVAELLREAAERRNPIAVQIATEGKIDLLDRPLNPQDLQGASKAELRIIRNTILARYGYPFRSQDLQKHFSRFSWYKRGGKAEAVNKLNGIDQRNIKTIRELERGR